MTRWQEPQDLTIEEMAAVFNGEPTGHDMPTMFIECLRRLREVEEKKAMVREFLLDSKNDLQSP